VQNKGYYHAVQGHSMSPLSVPIESPYATSYRFEGITDYCSNFGEKKRPLCVFDAPVGAYRQRTLFILGLFESS